MKTLNDFIAAHPLWYPADEGGAGGEGEGAGGDAGGEGGDAGAGGEGDAGGDKKLWWEGEDFAQSKEWMGKKGLLEEDPSAVMAKTIKGWQAAEARLGKPTESIMDRPAEGQSVAEWMRANADTFGLPDKPEGYELATLELPERMQVDEELMNGARQIAFDEGIPPAALEKFQALYAERMSGMFGQSEGDLKKANDEMRGTLNKDWGDQTDAKIGQAQTAFQALAQQAGMDEDEQMVAAQSLSKAHGDPMVMKMFASLAEMMGEDSLKGLGAGGGLTTTPAEAKAKIVQLNAKDGPYAKAIREKDTAAIDKFTKELERLNKIAVG